MSKGLIISGGHVSHDLLLMLLKNNYDYVMAVDHGMDALWVLGYNPDVILGDFDSCNKNAIDYFRREQVLEIRFNAEKDMTDTELALEKMIEKGITSADMVGTTGTRLDHTLANLMMLFKYENRINLTVLDKNNRIFVAKKFMEINKEGYHYISLLPISNKVTNVNLSKVKYPLREATLLRESSYAVSNEMVNQVCQLTFEDGKMLVIQSKD